MSKVEKFGKYILLEKLAAGGMAEVYLAKSNGANGVSKFVAVKRILPQFSTNEEFIDMFKEEAKVAINLNHSNVVSIYDFGIEKNQFYLVMEFVDGRNLRQIINELKKANKSISIDQAVYIVKEAASGLDHAHRCVDSKSGKPLNITHRDMSPQNIMISFEGEAKVIDFGIAKAEKETEATKAGTLKGKFAYMSPEQSEGLPIDPRTDVFALGIILWELLANDRLFTGSNEAAILRKVRDCQIPPIRKINPLVQPELERIVTKALAKDKNVRYQTAANLQKDLNRFLNTHYPDFSTQDFSHFIKESFKAAYSEGKDKLVQYSQLEVAEETATKTAPSSASAEPLVLPDIPHYEPRRSELPPIPAVSSKEPPLNPKGLESDQSNKIQLDGIRSAALQKGNPLNSAAKPNRPGEFAQGTRVTQMTRVTQSQRKGQSSQSDGSLFAKIIGVAALSFASYWGYMNYMVKPSNGKPAAIAKPNKPSTNPDPVKPNPTGVTESASKSAVNISVNSEPAGARIYINQKDTGQITPAILPVEPEKEVTISLIKTGYLKYETSKVYKQTSTLNATLEVPSDGGYINIHVNNGGARPSIYVNGVRLTEELPIRKYRIPANKEITVRAENAFTGLNDEVKVKVENEKTVDVQLILGRQTGATQ